MTDLDDQIREFYEDCCLDGHRISAILETGKICSRSCHVIRWSIGLAASVVFAALLAYALIPHYVFTSGPEHIVAGLATSHRERLEPEFLTGSYVELQDKLEKIHFSILPDNPYLRDQFELLGGRYCNLHTCLAVQLRLRNKATGTLVTLYVAALDPVLEQAHEDNQLIDGVRVQVWKSKDRFFAMAQDAHSTDV